MEHFDNIIEIYKQLANCRTLEEAKFVKRNSERFSLGESDEKEESSSRKPKVGQMRMSDIDRVEKNIHNLVKESKELITRGGFPDGLTLDAPEEMVVEIPAAELVGKQFQSNLNVILAWSMSNEVSRIGVLGMGGVGKTTLVKHVHNVAITKSEIFGFICWITVSKECSVKKLQNNIAKRVGLDLSNEDDECMRARTLAQAIKRIDKFVLFLDDMWEHFDENEVGIPKTKRCKLILTTRSEQVCRKMSCDMIIKVNHLSKEEAWDLFVRYIGHEIPSNLTEVANLVCKECAGLPLGIITLARSMRNNYETRVWRSVLNKLKSSKPDVEDMEAKVFKVLRLSYEHLNDPKLQECLLYCTAYPEDDLMKKDELIWGFIDRGLFNEMESIQDMIDEGFDTLSKLARACLLSQDKRGMKMHDLIRDMALQVAGSRFMIKAGVGIEEFPNRKMWSDDLELVSLMANHIITIPHISPKCQRLSMLLLQNNSFGSVPDRLFEYMDGLKVLNLSGTKIKILPNSISNLKNITALILRFCKLLECIPSLAELTLLERLDLRFTPITQSPKGLEKLTELMYLDLQQTNVDILPLEALPRGSILQYLSVKWLSVSGHDLTVWMNRIETFEGRFLDIDDFNAYVRHMHRGHKNYTIMVVTPPINYRHDVWTDDVLTEKKVYIERCKVNGGKDQRGSSVELPSDIQSLSIIECNDMWSLFDVYSTPLNRLEELVLVSLMELRSLFGATLPVSYCFFPQLRYLDIRNCPKIKKLFTLGMLLHLQNLEKLSIGNCEQLEEIIGTPSDGDGLDAKPAGIETNGYALPKLRTLQLFSLPELRSLSTSAGVIDCLSLEEINVYNCSKLRRMTLSLPLANHVHPLSYSSLPKIILSEDEKEWWELLEWDPPNTKTIFQPSYFITM